jgi:hypothetical protein
MGKTLKLESPQAQAARLIVFCASALMLSGACGAVPGQDAKGDDVSSGARTAQRGAPAIDQSPPDKLIFAEDRGKDSEEMPGGAAGTGTSDKPNVRPEPAADDASDQAAAADAQPEAVMPPEAVTEREHESLEELRARIETRDDGTVALDDMVFPSLEELERVLALQDDGEHDKGIYWSDKLWSRPGLVLDTFISVCFVATSTSTQAQRDRVRQLVTDSWQAVADVQFIGWGACTGNENITINHIAFTPLPVDQRRGGSQVGTNSVGVNPSMKLPADLTVVWQENTAVHEFGHAIGMLHEFLRADYPAGSCATADANIAGGETSAGGTVVTVGANYEAASIMSYCWPTSLIPLTATDIATAQQMYGPSDWPYVVTTGSWAPYPPVAVVIANTTLGSSRSVTSDLTQTLTSTEESFRMGDSWTASATAPDGNWTCSGDSGSTPPGGFSGSSMRVNCYRPAEIMAAVM